MSHVFELIVLRFKQKKMHLCNITFKHICLGPDSAKYLSTYVMLRIRVVPLASMEDTHLLEVRHVLK